jgi:hypothetical protein
MQFTTSQQEAIAAFNDFLDGQAQVFMLKGAAGTGKTTLVTEFMQITNDRYRQPLLMAPTGRAAYVLSKKTNHGANTIHRTIYQLSSLRSTDQNKDEIDSESVYARFAIRKNKTPFDAVYFVDEASMISDSFSENESFSFGSGKLLSDLFEFAGGRKIVFIGDYAQLPPIGMNFSPALDNCYIQERFDCVVVEHMLREVLRQSNNGVMLSNATRIRDCIEAKSFIEFQLIDGCDSHAEDNDLLKPYYSLSEASPSEKAAIITYSNRQALQYNQTIRKHYYGEMVPRLIAGDLLMVARNNYAFETELFNGNIVKVVKCDADNDVEQRIVRVKTGKDKIDVVQLVFRNVVIKFLTSDKVVELKVKLLDNFLDSPSSSIGGALARALIVDFNNRIPEQIKVALPTIKKQLRNKEDLSTEQQQVYQAYLNLLLKDPYYNALICKYGYSVTCHKAQGGEWENVFVDMDRFGGTANEDYFRWAYTALTRASKNIWHYRAPEFNYLSKLVVEPIQLSTHLKVSTFSKTDDFCADRFARIQQICSAQGITVDEDKTRNYQHWITFTASITNETAVISMWYNAKGYSNKNMVQKTTSEEFAALCSGIISGSLVPADVPFADTRSIANKLVDFVKFQLKELDIQLLNITQDQYQYVFHLKTDGVARVIVFYNDKGFFTYMKLASTLGEADSKLVAFRNCFA